MRNLSPRRSTYLFALLSLLISALPAGAGVLSGSVTDADSSASIEGVEVSVYRAVASGGWTGAGFTNTDAAGSYSLTLDDGDYRVLFRDWSGTYAFEYFPDASRIENASDVTVAGATALDAALADAGRISGDLTAPDGSAVEHAFVAVYEEREPLGNVLFIDQPSPGSTTFDIGGLPDGDYIVRLSGYVDGTNFLEYFDGVSLPQDATPVEVEVGETSTISVVLGDVSGLDISGTVSDSAAQPLVDIEVWLFRWIDDHWSFQEYRTTGAGGTYLFADLEPATYTLHARDWSGEWAYEYWQDESFLEHADEIEIDTASFTADFSLDVAGRIAGTVSDPVGGALDTSLIAVFDEHEELLFVQQPGDTTYDIGGLPTGEYYVRFNGSQGNRHYQEFFDDAPDFAAATRVEVTASQTSSGIDAVLGLEPGGTIRGFVRDPYGREFDFATVTAFEDDGGTWTEVNSIDAFYLDDDFDYALDVPPGTFRVRFEAGSWVGEDLGTVIEFYDDVIDIASGSDVTVGLDELVKDIDAELGDQSTGTISGTVTGASGTPLEGVEVLVANRRGGVLWDQIALTAADGTYTVTGLWPERYSVRFYDPQGRVQSLYFGGGAALQDATPVAVGDGNLAPSDVTGIDVSLSGTPTTGSIAGTLTDGSAQPLGNVVVAAYQSPCEIVDDYVDCDFVTRSLTAADGTYRLRDLAAGDYLLQFRRAGDPFTVNVVGEFYDDVGDVVDATPVTVAAAMSTDGIDAVLDLAGSIAGTVTDPFGNGFSILSATAYRFADGEWQFVRSDTELNGTDYRIDGLAAGTYRVAFSGGGWTPSQRDNEVYDNVQTLDAGTDVVVTAGAVTGGIDAELGEGPAGGISGTVTDGGGNPVEGVLVTVFDSYGTAARSATTDAAGEYLVDLLFADFYRVGFEDPAGVLPNEFYLDVASLESATPVLVEDAVVTGIDAALDGANTALGGGVIRGTVTAAAGGAPIEGVSVRCRPADEDEIFAFPCSGTTAADGSYEIGGNLLAGDYRVDFSSSGGAWASETYDGQIFAGDATPVAVSVGAATSNIDAALEPGAGISGTVTREDGSAYGLLYVSLYGFDAGTSSWRFVDGAVFLSESDYEIDGLPPGTYRVRFRGSEITSITQPDVEFYDDVAEVEDGTDVVLVGGQVTANIDAVLGDLSDEMVGNGDFDQSLDDWLAAPGPTSAFEFSQRDVLGDDASGSAYLEHNGLESLSALSQCVQIGQGSYELSAWIEVSSALSEDPRTTLLFEPFAGGDCGGESLQAATAVAEISGDTGGWLKLEGPVTMPAGSGSVRLSVAFDAGAAPSFTAHVDDVDLRAPLVLFTDGFESGGLGAWSLAVGE